MGEYLVVDLEAIRDDGVWTAPEPDPPSDIWTTDGYGRKLVGSVERPQREVFAPPQGWRPVVIGCVWLEGAFGYLKVKRVGAIDVPKDGDPDAWERDLLQQFANFMSMNKVARELVTWNGRAFDVPVLMMRSMRHGIPHPWYYGGRGCRYRFSEEGHIDLADAMSDYGAARHLSLDSMAKLIGLPGKVGDIDGAKVGEAFAAGRHEEIRTYCVVDTIMTAALFIRWQFLKGEMDLAHYREAAGDLLKHCEAQPALKPFVDRVDRKVLLLEGAPSAAAASKHEAA